MDSRYSSAPVAFPPREPTYTPHDAVRDGVYDSISSAWRRYRQSLSGPVVLLVWTIALLVAHACWTQGARPDGQPFPLVAFLLFISAPTLAVVSTLLWGRPPAPARPEEVRTARPQRLPDEQVPIKELVRRFEAGEIAPVSLPPERAPDWEVSLAHLLVAAPVGALLTLLLVVYSFGGYLPEGFPLGKCLLGGALIAGGLASVFHDKFWDAVLRPEPRDIDWDIVEPPAQ